MVAGSAAHLRAGQAMGGATAVLVVAATGLERAQLASEGLAREEMAEVASVAVETVVEAQGWDTEEEMAVAARKVAALEACRVAEVACEARLPGD